MTLAVPGLDAGAVVLRNHFLGWQCRVRQYAIRHDAGRPSAGMRPVLTVAGHDPAVSRKITTVLIKQDSVAIAKQFRHMVSKTNDPNDRYHAALKYLAADYYQNPQEFSDRITALFAIDSPFAAAVTAAGICTLNFDHATQRYRLPCGVRALTPNDDAFQTTYWHNRLFNPAMPSDVRILEMTPDWPHAEADPTPP
ncbi:MAG: hypothetical protein OEQ39_03100 [Gammaproteobacteria bacterium]|nr:hypothetical protein [Gammaproteobacteria bacterium]MDH3464641.1 hypothetical protein [Gammaproteobacteria bacterium]